MAKKKIVVMGAEAKQEVRKGVKYVADAVRLTMGPYGRNFASGIRGGPIAISNDGVSLSKEMVGTAPNEFQEIGLRAAVEAATKTNDIVGDGTTGSVVMMDAILESTGFDKDVIVGQSVVAISEKIRKESDFVVEKLNEMAVPIKDRTHLIQVAKVSVEDAELAELIGGTQFEIGQFGTMIAEEHNLPTDTVEMLTGVRWDSGFTSSRFITNQEKQSLDLEEVHVLLTDKIFNTVDSMVALKELYAELIKEGSKGLVIIGRAFDEGAIGFCVKNLTAFAEGKGGFPIYPVNSPYTDQDNIMEDIAAVTGGKYIKDKERNMETLRPVDAGFAKKISIKRFEGVVVGKPQGEDEHITKLVGKRLEDIEEKLKGDVSPFETRMLQARKAQLTTGTAIVKIGAQSEAERRYKKDKADDAINAVKAAIQHGVVPGGGMALYLIAGMMPEGSLLTEALRATYKQISANAGGNFTVEDNIQDPLKVIRTAFEKASSVARALSTTEIAINWQEEKPQYVTTTDNKISDSSDEE